MNPSLRGLTIHLLTWITINCMYYLFQIYIQISCVPPPYNINNTISFASKQTEPLSTVTFKVSSVATMKKFLDLWAVKSFNFTKDWFVPTNNQLSCCNKCPTFKKETTSLWTVYEYRCRSTQQQYSLSNNPILNRKNVLFLWTVRKVGI